MSSTLLVATTDYLHTIKQIIERSNEFNLPLCIAYIDYEKAFDLVEHNLIFQTLRNIGINETYINIIETSIMKQKLNCTLKNRIKRDKYTKRS